MQAEHTSFAKALYDYDAAAPGELSIREDEILMVFDREDEWILVQSQKGGKAGFVPGNYIEEVYFHLLSGNVHSLLLKSSGEEVPETEPESEHEPEPEPEPVPAPRPQFVPPSVSSFFVNGDHSLAGVAGEPPSASCQCICGSGRSCRSDSCQSTSRQHQDMGCL